MSDSPTLQDAVKLQMAAHSGDMRRALEACASALKILVADASTPAPPEDGSQGDPQPVRLQVESHITRRWNGCGRLDFFCDC